MCIGPSIKHKHIFETLSSCAFLTHLIIIKSNIDALPGSTIASLLNLQVIDVSDNMLVSLIIINIIIIIMYIYNYQRRRNFQKLFPD